MKNARKLSFTIGSTKTEVFEYDFLGHCFYNWSIIINYLLGAVTVMYKKKYTENYLNQLSTMRVECDEIKRRLIELKASTKSLHSVIISDRVLNSHTNSSNKVIDEYVDLETTYCELHHKMIDAEKRILNEIELLEDNTQKSILKLRFVYKNSMLEISNKIFVSKSQAYRIYVKALEEFYEKNLIN